MTTLVEEMSKAIFTEYHPDAKWEDVVYKDGWRRTAQAALEAVLKRLREPDEGMVNYVSGFGGHSDQETIDMIRAVSTHLDQERSRE
jgi:hypothetical protein